MACITACGYDCPDCCSLLVETDGQEVRVKGNPEHPFTKGLICAKGRGIPQRLRSPERITQPLKRSGQDLVPISWDEALSSCAEHLDRLAATPTQVLHARGHGYRGVLGAASKFFFRAFGASCLYGSLCDDTGIEACLKDFGTLDTNDPQDWLNTSLMVNWGRDLSRTSIHLLSLVKTLRKQGVLATCISPGGDDWQRYADEHIRIRPGTDRFLALAVLAMLFQDKDPGARVMEASRDPERFLAMIRAQDISRLLSICNVARSKAEHLAELYASKEPVLSLISWGLQRYTHGGENVRFINALSFLAGHVGRPGGGAVFNHSSARNFHPWHREAGEYGRKLLLQDLPNELAKADPPVRMIWVDGHNLVNQIPDARAMARAFEQTEVTVVVDAFMTDTALRADLVLPCALPLEREDVYGSFLHNYVNYAGPCLEPPGEALEDFQIMKGLGERLGRPIAFPDSEDILARAIREDMIPGGINTLREKGFARAEQSMVAFENLRFGHEDGQYRFPNAPSPEETAPHGFPLRLLSLIDRNHIHSQILESEQEGRLKAWVAPDNPHSPTPGPATLESPLGRIEVELAHLPGLHPEVVAVRRGGWLKYELSPNAVIPCRMTDMGHGCAFYSTWVRLLPGQE